MEEKKISYENLIEKNNLERKNSIDILNPQYQFYKAKNSPKSEQIIIPKSQFDQSNARLSLVQEFQDKFIKTPIGIQNQGNLPSPSILVAQQIQQPAQIYDEYKSLHKCQIYFGLIFILISALFELAIPILVGFLIRQYLDQYIGEDGGQFSDILNLIIILFFILAAVSSFFSSFSYVIYKNISEKICLQISYDIYHNQMKRILNKKNSEFQQPIDYKKSMQNYKVRELEEYLEPLKENMQKYYPSGQKAKIVVFLSVFALFFLSWKLGLILIFGSMFVFFIRKCIQSKKTNSEQSWKNQIFQANNFLLQSFKQDADIYQNSKNLKQKYDKIQKSIITNLIQDGFIQVFGDILLNSLIISILIASYYFQKNNNNMDSLIMDQLGRYSDIHFDFLISFFLYIFTIQSNLQTLFLESRQSNKTLIFQSQNKLFELIKLQPILIDKNQEIEVRRSQSQEKNLKQSLKLSFDKKNRNSKSIDSKDGTVFLDQSNDQIYQDALQDSIAQSNISNRIIQKSSVREFLGSKIIQNMNSRTELPVLKPEAPMPIWQIIGKFIGQDITKVSMPVALNEPLSGPQRLCEAVVYSEDLFRRAAMTQDPIKRTAIALVAQITCNSITQFRQRKPFNPMLGETYELVTENYKFLCEKVKHNPDQVTCFQLEGKDYIFRGYNYGKFNFKFNSGRGMLDIEQNGLNDVYFKNHDEWITSQKPHCLAKNIIFGTLYIDFEGTIKAINHKHKVFVELTYFPKKDKINSYIEGTAYDSNGRPHFKIQGSWMNEIKLFDINTGETEVIWTEMPLIQNAHLQYFFNKISVVLNYKNKEMEGIIAPTDSRWRNDLRYFEEDLMEEADNEKVLIEEEQRRKRKIFEVNKQEWKPLFFDEVPHPFLRKQNELNILNPIQYKLIENKGDQKGYWERRQKGDWNDLPNLWGPFDKE